MTDFERFWKAYPKRNNKKPGKDFCSLWFEAKKPDTKTVDKMVEWLRIDKANRETVLKKGDFYSLPCDAKRFLKERMWGDPIGIIVPKEQKMAKQRGDMVKRDNIKAAKEQYSSWLAVKSIEEIKGQRTPQSKQFIQLKNQYPELREWALTIRPDLKSEKPSVDADLPPPAKKELRDKAFKDHLRDVMRAKEDGTILEMMNKSPPLT